jgi:acetyl/propionyl-CoA carboxylase alpha subunit/acetyl-CoA carboxylase carboxyltransferase component
MPVQSTLVANRGEIATRIARALSSLNIRSVGVYTPDDAGSAHVRQVDEAVALPGSGPAGYLDIEAVIAAAKDAGCDSIHPGYGLLSENAAFARRCAEEGLTFIGPSAETLELFGDKSAARRLARDCGVPVVPGTESATSLEAVQAFFAEQPEGRGIMIKALAGGGGRGMRAVYSADEIPAAYERCQSEAKAGFGNDAVYVEALVGAPRHIEVQVLGDGEHVVHLGERDCTLQRRHQKLVEMAPAPGLSEALREKLFEAALAVARQVHYTSLATFEFLVAGDDFFFIEANPRLQVEHTVTEMVTGLDLVALQMRVAGGASLEELGLSEPPLLRGRAIQLRINTEAMQADGSARPTAGTLSAYEPPGGPGVRVDGCGYAGYATNPNFDSLLAKLIVHEPGSDHTALLHRAYHALCGFRIEGVVTNIPLLQNLLQHSALMEHRVDTRFVEREIKTLLAEPAEPHPQHYFGGDTAGTETQQQTQETPAGCIALNAPVAGTLSKLLAQPGDNVTAGQTLAIIESMKMEFEVKAGADGTVRNAGLREGTLVHEGAPVLFLETDAEADDDALAEELLDLEHIPDNLAEVLERQAMLLDENRPEAVAKRHKLGMRTARENLAALLDADSFNEYGGLALAAQRQRRKHDELLKLSPADGLVGGTGTINAEHFGPDRARCMAMAYDYTVFAGTQGMMNHKKTDRLLTLAEEWRLPLVLFAEGGGGRPGETDFPGVAGLDNMTFLGLAKLSGLVPLVSVVNGRCFAGNAALAGCCDVIIATESATLGMAGPAMIEGGGLGRYKPEEVGPVSMQAPNGVMDIVVKDEAQAAATARQYLGYFQGDLPDWRAEDQRLLRQLIPEHRLRVYDIRRVIASLCDTGSVLELREQFAPGMITALVRIEGKPFGLIANNPQHLGGAIDSEGSDKAARFMQLCDAFDLPLISLCDTPGFMVGPEAEKTASVRHMSRLFTTAASLSIPVFTVVLRKGYGLGAQAMAAGSFHAPVFTIAWPSGEFGAMGLEGAIRLGYAKELAAIEDPKKRERVFNMMVRKAYEHGKGLNMASYLEIDNVIDPVETRAWLLRGLASVPTPPARDGKKRPMVDNW